MQRFAPRPCGCGSVMRQASAVVPKPVNSAWMCAPRAFACSSSSITTMPAPSPITNPSRVRSNGRLARFGSAPRVDRAVRRLKPVMPSGWIMLCDPPATTTSASPQRIRSIASPTACELAAHAVWHEKFGPSRANSFAMCPAVVCISISASRAATMAGWTCRANLPVVGLLRLPAERRRDGRHHHREVFGALAGAEVHAEAPAVAGRVVQQVGVGERLPPGRERELRVQPAEAVPRHVREGGS